MFRRYSSQLFNSNYCKTMMGLLAASILISPHTALAQSREQIANDWFIKGVTEGTCTYLRGGADYSTAFNQAYRETYNFIRQSDMLSNDQKRYLFSVYANPSDRVGWFNSAIEARCPDTGKTTIQRIGR